MVSYNNSYKCTVVLNVLGTNLCCWHWIDSGTGEDKCQNEWLVMDRSFWDQSRNGCLYLFPNIIVLKEPLTLSKSDMEHLAVSLNSRSSLFVRHYAQLAFFIQKVRPSLLATGTLSILLDHCCWTPIVVNKLTALLFSTSARHSRQIRVSLRYAIDGRWYCMCTRERE